MSAKLLRNWLLFVAALNLAGVAVYFLLLPIGLSFVWHCLIGGLVGLEIGRRWPRAWLGLEGRA